MNLIQTYHADLLNGEGLREVLFFSGCTHHCPGCFSPETWDPFTPRAHEFSAEDKRELWENLAKPYISGVTFSGGDPLSPWNREGVTKLAEEIKAEFPGKTVWVYSGYTYESLAGERILEVIDVLCDGRFIQSLASPKKPWVGSENQRVINVPESLKTGKVVVL